MAAQVTPRHVTRRRTDLRPGALVRITFGHRTATGVVLGETITGRCTAEVHVEGADDPVTTSYRHEELDVA